MYIFSPSTSASISSSDDRILGLNFSKVEPRGKHVIVDNAVFGVLLDYLLLPSSSTNDMDFWVLFDVEVLENGETGDKSAFNNVFLPSLLLLELWKYK